VAADAIWPDSTKEIDAKAGMNVVNFDLTLDRHDNPRLFHRPQSALRDFGGPAEFSLLVAFPRTDQCMIGPLVASPPPFKSAGTARYSSRPGKGDGA